MLMLQGHIFKKSRWKKVTISIMWEQNMKTLHHVGAEYKNIASEQNINLTHYEGAEYKNIASCGSRI